PLKETSAEVQIAGVIARVKVKQVFANEGAKPIEAVYVFPGSTRAAVHGMRMTIGKRTIEAKIDKKAEARQQYEQAKQEGKRASLLEQERPNVFTMNVANIMPRDRIEVELDYSELLVPEDATYEFVYPTVVGPRYTGGMDAKKDKWAATPYTTEGQGESYKWDIRVHIETGIPLKEIASPSHKVIVKKLGDSSADVVLDQAGGGNKDFVLQYRLAGNKIETGVLLWQGQDENFFVVMMEPPKRPTDQQIPPREYIFLLDVSGSMHGFPLDTTKALMKNLFTQLRPTDYFNCVFFSGGSFVLNPQGSVPATPGNIDNALQVINRQRGGGGTELMGGLKTAYGIPKTVPHLSRSVIVATDGYVGVEAAAFKFIRDNLNQANLFAFGIGSSVNRALIEGMARAGLGEPYVVLRPDKAAEQAERLQAVIQFPVLAGIDVKFNKFSAYEVAPSKVPDLMAKRPVIVFGKYKGNPAGSIEVTGYSGQGKFTQKLDVSEKQVRGENAPIRFLWARKWVAILDDEYVMSNQAKEVEEVITDLGLAYTLLTQFTSFVAIDSEVVNQGGQGDQVKQPLPLPEGVSNLAVGSGEAVSKTMALPARRSVSRKDGEARPSPMPSPVQAPAESPASYAPSAPPPPSGGFTGRPMPKYSKKSRAEVYDEDRAAGERRIMIVGLKAAGLGDTKALIAAIEGKLAAVAKECASGETTLKLKITVDASGKVTKVEIIESKDKKLGDCLKKKLTGLSSATKATGKSGTLELTLRAL
ncbi:MAG: VWA domain-containing protein, partial [Deltaproteobacteria bacterium]|nr:VWA domain-containing protein [Deltaproteobacteria bacterium]